MDKIIALVSNITGMAGMFLTVAAGVARVGGHYHLGGFEVMTLFVGGMGLMLIGCFAKLCVLTHKRA